MSTCSICPTKHYAKGLCEKHYKRNRAHGDPTITVGAEHGAALLLMESAVASSTDECIISPHTPSQRYATVKIHGTDHKQHVLVCERTHGPRPAGYDASHLCGVSRCINPRHIVWESHKDNMARQDDQGTRRASTEANAKLNDEAVRRIRSRRAAGEGFASLAHSFAVHENTIRSITRRESWKHIE